MASLEAEQQKDVSPWKKRITYFNTCKLFLLPTVHLQTKRDTDVTPKYEDRELFFFCRESSSDVPSVMGLLLRAKDLQFGTMAVTNL